MVIVMGSAGSASYIGPYGLLHSRIDINGSHIQNVWTTMFSRFCYSTLQGTDNCITKLILDFIENYVGPKYLARRYSPTECWHSIPFPAWICGCLAEASSYLLRIIMFLRIAYGLGIFFNAI